MIRLASMAYLEDQGDAVSGVTMERTGVTEKCYKKTYLLSPPDPPGKT